jgi:hypothetical protein
MALPKELQGGKDRKGPVPDMDSIHRWPARFFSASHDACSVLFDCDLTELYRLDSRALFNKKSGPGKKQTFTITMPKKSKDEQERW